MTDSLEQAFGFASSDLAALRLGLLPPDYQRRLRQATLRQYGHLLIGLVGMAVITLGYGVWAYGPASVPTLGAILAVCAALVIVLNHWSVRRELAALQRGRVFHQDTLAGDWPYRRRRNFGFVSGDVRVALSGRAQAALVPGRRYRVYFLEGTGQVLGVEALADT